MIKFTPEKISLCKQIAEKHRKEIEYGDWHLNQNDEKDFPHLFKTQIVTFVRSAGNKHIIPLWTISDCLEFFEEKGLNHIFNFKHFKLGDWSFTAEDNKYKKVRGEGKTRLTACLKAVLAVLEEGK